MKPLVVVPFHDPKWLGSTLTNLAHQTHKLPVLFVFNGEAARLRLVLSHNSITSAPGHAAAVNAGAARAAELGYTHAVLFDSDDYYGPAYTTKVLTALEHADFCGQQQVFARMQNGEVHLLRRPGRCFVFATAGFRIERFLPVTDVLDNFADWSQRMLASGATMKELSAEGYCYFRHGANAHWDGRLTDELVRTCWGPSLNYGRVDPSVCDASEGRPFVECPKPTNDEIFAGLSAAFAREPVAE